MRHTPNYETLAKKLPMATVREIYGIVEGHYSQTINQSVADYFSKVKSATVSKQGVGWVIQ